MSDYDFRPGGSLKLKGKDGEGLKKKKKSSKSHDKSVADADKARERQRVKDMLLKDDTGPGSGSGSARDSPIPGGSGSRKTDAERRFEEAQRERLAAKVGKLASKTHKDRVADFNAKLEALSEHHDIPKVGPG